MIPPIAEQIIDLALEEDVGRGDVTTRLTVPGSSVSTGRVLSREDLVMSGGDVFERVMKKVDPGTEVQLVVSDGDRCGQDDLMIVTRGPTSSLLMAERVALNFLQRLCGVATMTRRYVDLIPEGAGMIVTDTRKTTPGMRYWERMAVIHGGGRNHRSDLGGGILIKENHIAIAGSVAQAVRLCMEGSPHPLKVEVEVRTLEELEQALAAGAEAVLLDNMSLEEVESCVRLASGKAFIEVSGGIGLESVAQLARLGVDAISVGGLTHSSPAADMSFLLDGE